MRILHVLDHGLSLRSGYTVRTQAIMAAQDARGHAVAAVSGPRPRRPARDVERLASLSLHRDPRPHGVLGGAAALLSFAHEIADAIDVFRPDVIHAHAPVPGLLAAQHVARRHGLPLVCEVHAFAADAAAGDGGRGENALRYRAARTIETWIARHADAVVATGEAMARDLAGRGIDPGRIVVSPNGVDMARFDAAPPRDAALATSLGLDGAEVIGFVGSFHHHEGLDDLIAALPALVAARPAATLLLVGDGPAAPGLHAAAMRSPMPSRIRFVDRVPHAEVGRYYALIDVLAYPRRRTRLTDLVAPLKPLEAMAQGRLVAASDVGGHRELIRDGVTGTLFAADDPPAIARTLAGLLGDRADWDGRRARAHAFVQAEGGWSSSIGGYDPVYQRLADARSRSGAWRPAPVRAVPFHS